MILVQMDTRYCTPKDIARIVGYTPSTARRLIRKEMPFLKLRSGRILVERERFDAWMAGATVKPSRKIEEATE